ncbi:MAG TPA: DUF2807 domain-containing protein [Rhizomicrobium sp.]|nr:DUF2807 domain-containing protein [Rhizomicrobium sp.]
MRTSLAVLALSGVALSIACLGAAAAAQGAGRISFFGSDMPRCDLSTTGQTATRSLKWDGSDTAGIAVPATVHYRRGQGDQVVVKGDSALLPHIEIVDGSVQLNCRLRNFRGERLDVTLPGRAFKGFGIAGTGDMTLENLDQPDLEIHVAGAGKVAADGKVQSLELHVAGSGDAKLAGLAVDRMAVHVAGSSNIDAAPKDDLDVHIAGSGTVMLHSEPHSIETHIVGSGRIIHPDGSVSGRHQHI